MKQSDVFKHVYESLMQKLCAYSSEYEILSAPYEATADGQAAKQIAEKPAVWISVSDIVQTAIDKSGQRVIVDELLYEVPTRFALSLQIHVYAKDYPSVLSVLGAVAVCLKDDPAVPAGECNWHGNECAKVFFEPMVRRLDINAAAEKAPYCTASLSYCAECAVNSEHGESFRRVEKTDLRSNVIDDEESKDA